MTDGHIERRASDRRIEVIVRPAPTTIAEVSSGLRDLVARAAELRSAAGRDDRQAIRTWAVLGEFEVPEASDGSPEAENERAVVHDRVGRLAVRLAVDKTLCVGESRAIRALHQGAVMEGSWGDEVRMVGSLDEARAAVDSGDDWRPAPGDVVLVAGSPGALADLTASWQDQSGEIR